MLSNLGKASVNMGMRIAEIIKTANTKTPDQLRVDSLKGNAERAAKAVRAEKARQKLVKAQQEHRAAQITYPDFSAP